MTATKTTAKKTAAKRTRPTKPFPQPTAPAPAEPEAPVAEETLHGQPAIGTPVLFESDAGTQAGWVHAHELINPHTGGRATETPNVPACVVAWATGGLSGPIDARLLTV